MQIATKHVLEAELSGLDAPGVWDTEKCFQHLRELGLVETKRTAERRLLAIGLVPEQLKPEQLLDELGHRPISVVVQSQIDRARAARHLVLFSQLKLTPHGNCMLHANDARGARYWVPINTGNIGAQAIENALAALQQHIGKPIVVFPHGTLVVLARAASSQRDVAINLLAYASPVHPIPQAARSDMHAMPSSRLKRLEAEAIHILREAVAEAETPAMLYSVGKDSSVMLHIARKAFYPSKPPFKLVQTDTSWKPQEMHSFDIVLAGCRLDEEKSPAKEHLFSIHAPAPRVLPISNWTELDIWQYIYQEGIPVVPLYFAQERPVVRRNGMLLVVNDDRFKLLPGEQIEGRKVRFRTLGGYPLTGAIESEASTVADIILELESARNASGYREAPPSVAQLSERLVFPVQWVINQPESTFRGLSGTVAEGSVRRGDIVRVTASGQTAAVANIVTMDAELQEAKTGDAVTLVLDRNIDAARGDVLSLAKTPLEMTDQFEATLVWLGQDPGHTGRTYDIKLASQLAGATITTIKYRVDVNTQSHDASTQLVQSDTSVCNIATSKPLVADAYKKSTALGGFLLVDRFSHATVARGKIHHSLRRSQNVHRQALSIARTDRENLNGHQGRVVWFTGLSGSGKSTIANALEVRLHALGQRTYILDGDNVRQGLNKDLGFTDTDRVENIRRVAEVAKLMMDAGLVVLTAFISPFRQERKMARDLIGSDHFLEVYVSTPLAVCEQRDVKGLYKKARNGQLPNLTGVNSPYEPPEQPDITLDSNLQPVSEAIETLLQRLKGIN